jgi:hypothetical protein
VVNLGLAVGVVAWAQRLEANRLSFAAKGSKSGPIHRARPLAHSFDSVPPFFSNSAIADREKRT